MKKNHANIFLIIVILAFSDIRPFQINLPRHLFKNIQENNPTKNINIDEVKYEKTIYPINS